MSGSLFVQIIVEVAASGIVGILTAGVIILFKRIPKELGQLTRDWYGAPARPGFSAVPGIPQRLENVETHLANQDKTLARIDHEITFNSGTSIKDVVHRTEKAVDGLTASLHEHILVANRNEKTREIGQQTIETSLRSIDAGR